MRLAQVFKRPPGMEQVRIVGVEIDEESAGTVVTVEVALPKRQRLCCSGCGHGYARRTTATASAVPGRLETARLTLRPSGRRVMLGPSP
jgi:transposase-like protein